MCTIPKALMDDIEHSYPGRTKEGENDKLKQAMFKGIYDGWEAGVKARKDGTKQPLPIFNFKKGKVVETRKAHAQTAMGFHFLIKFWQELRGVDFHKFVSSFHCAFAC